MIHIPLLLTINLKKKKKGNEEGDLRLYISVYGENVCLVKYYKYNFYLLKHTAH